MKIKTSELNGRDLDLAVAVALGHKVTLLSREEIISFDSEMDDEEKAFHRSKPPRVRIEHGPCPGYSTDWAQGGPIIEYIGIDAVIVDNEAGNVIWAACLSDPWGAMRRKGLSRHGCTGGTPLIAAMRCFVASKLGDEVDIPPELINT